MLYYKDKMEEKLGIQLTWDRNDDKQSSRIYHEIDYLDIENEIDWLQAAQFHTEWSDNFYDVFIPYLENARAEMDVY